MEKLYKCEIKVTQKNVDPHTISKVQSSSVNFLIFGTKSNVFNKEFLSLVTK